MSGTLAAVLGYLGLQLAIGVWVSRAIKTEADYLVAGRSLGYVLMTFSIFATWFGAETIVGSAGTAYGEGVSLASAEPFGYGLCLILMGLVFAVPLWRRRLTTLADLFRERFSVGVERLAAVILIPSSILWAAAQTRAFGHVLSTSSTLDPAVAIGMAAGFTLLYTMFGGLLVDAITDLIQGLMLVLGLTIVFVATVVALGGAGGTLAAMHEAAAIRGPAPAVPLLVALEAWAIPVCGSVIATELVGRIIAARAPQVARRSSFAAGALYIAVGSLPVVIGLAGPAIVPSLADPEQIIPAVAQRLLPTVLYVVFAGGLISAILSTVDSTLLIASGLLSHNLLVPLFGVEDERTKVRLARGGVALFGIIAFFLAVNAEGVFALVEQASALGSAGALVTVTFGLFTRFGGPRTAAATLLTGLAVYLVGVYGGWSYPYLASLGASVGVYVIGGAVEPATGAETGRMRIAE